VYGTRVYLAWVGPKGLAMERFPDIKKKKKNAIGLIPIIVVVLE
jgi:hypothetical protein